MAHHNKSVNVHQFAMNPKADIPRSAFKIEKAHKTTIDAGWLYPIYVDEVLPGDTFHLKATMFGRLATPIVPVMDNIYLDSFWFFVPMRLVWNNFEKFMGAQDNPGDSISYLIPTVTCPAGGFAPLTIYDYMGLPTVGQVNVAGTVACNSLPLRAYALIFNEWFRDENLQNSIPCPLGDGPDNPATDFGLMRRGKRHDYFTSALTAPQKGPSVSVPLGISAPVVGNGETLGFTHFPTLSGAGTRAGLSVGGANNALFFTGDSGTAAGSPTAGVPGFTNANRTVGVDQDPNFSGLVADLSTATAATINQLRQSFQIQKLLERDARGGTRYNESVFAHFGVRSPDARLQRPEYLGGGSQRIAIQPIPQTSETQDTPQGNLAAYGTVLAQGHGFNQSFVEHGYIIGIVSVRADLTYQQGLRKMWSRRTRYDFYWPAFAMLGEQAILNKEIYVQGLPADELVFGYQERWAEMRYNPSMITGLFRSTTANTIDVWHLAQRFNTLPTLGTVFISEEPPLDRVLAVQEEAAGQQIILDIFTQCKAARPMPMFSVPGLIDHF